MADVNGAPSNAQIDVITPADDAPAEFANAAEAAAALTAARQPKKPPAEAVEQPELEARDEKSRTEADNSDPETDPAEEPNEAEPEEIPPIEPPRSWTKAEKERFQSLPRETQEYLHTREQERERDFRRSQNEAAEERKAIAAEREAAKQERLQYEAKAKAYIQATNETGAFADIQNMKDLEKLQTEDPFRFQAYQLHVWKTQAAKAELADLEQKQKAEKQSKRAEYEAEQNTRLVDLVPEMADPKKASELRDRAVKMLNDDLGLKTEQLSRWMADDTGHEILSNAGIQKLIADGLKYQDIKAAPKAIAVKSVPPVTRPGTSKPASSSRDEQLQALQNNFNKSGSLRDAEALRTAQLLARRRA